MNNDFKKVAVYIRTAVPNDNEVKKTGRRFVKCIY